MLLEPIMVYEMVFKLIFVLPYLVIMKHLYFNLNYVSMFNIYLYLVFYNILLTFTNE